MSSVLVLASPDGRFRDVAVNGRRIARYPATDNRAENAARIIRGRLRAGMDVPYGLIPQPFKWLSTAEDDPFDAETYACAECGHLHWLGPIFGYEPCPICTCQGQPEQDAA